MRLARSSSLTGPRPPAGGTELTEGRGVGRVAIGSRSATRWWTDPDGVTGSESDKERCPTMAARTRGRIGQDVAGESLEKGPSGADLELEVAGGHPTRSASSGLIPSQSARICRSPGSQVASTAGPSRCMWPCRRARPAGPSARQTRRRPPGTRRSTRTTPRRESSSSVRLTGGSRAAPTLRQRIAGSCRRARSRWMRPGPPAGGVAPRIGGRVVGELGGEHHRGLGRPGPSDGARAVPGQPSSQAWGASRTSRRAASSTTRVSAEEVEERPEQRRLADPRPSPA